MIVDIARTASDLVWGILTLALVVVAILADSTQPPKNP